MATKSSILIFYIRLSKNTQKLLRTSSYVTLAVVNVAGVVLTFFNIFQCNPVSAAYDMDSKGKCISIVTLFLCSAPVNIITDLAILILPIPILTGMTLPQRQKIALVFTFALGIFVTIVDVVRIYYLQKASDDQLSISTQVKLRFGRDFYYHASTALLWSAVEVNVGIICACIPTLKPLLKKIVPSILRDRNGSVTKNTYASETNSDEARRVSARAKAAPIQPLPPSQENSDQEQSMGMMDFLTTPEDDTTTEPQRSIVRYETTNSVYFGFIDMKRPKSMLKTRGMESFKYCMIVTILFFLWGFSYGLLNILNNEISRIAHESEAQTLGLSAVYFVAYFFAPLTLGQWVLRHGGFKATFITGLCIYGIGTLMFWPSAVLVSFPGFIICQFVVGFGLSVLETAANPFLALCGPQKYAETRLLLAQGVQGIGTVLSQLLAHKIFFSNLRNRSLIDVQWAYLAITLFTAMLALFFYYMPLPEATDADLAQQASKIPIQPNETVGPRRLKLRLIYTTLTLAIIGQTLYVAAQESHSTFFAPLLTSLSTPPVSSTPLTLTTTNYTLLAATTFALGRFLFAPLTTIIAPRILLLTVLLLGSLFAFLTTITATHISPNSTAAFGLVFSFFEGPAFPLIFAIGLRGMGRNTKWAAAGLTAAASGGAGATWIMFGIMRSYGGHSASGIRASYWVVVALMVAGCAFPVYLNVCGGARRQVDPGFFNKSKPGSASGSGDGILGVPPSSHSGSGPAPRANHSMSAGHGNGELSIGDVGGLTNGSSNHPSQPAPEPATRRFSRRFSEMFSKIGNSSTDKRDAKRSSAGSGRVVVEHREGQRDV